MALCRECSKDFAPREKAALFCSTPCRKAFNNRRAVRGQALYDLWMSHRYDRGLAKVWGCLALMCALGQQYREEDVARRGQDWRSWSDPSTVLNLKPWLRAKAGPV